MCTLNICVSPQSNKSLFTNEFVGAHSASNVYIDNISTSHTHTNTTQSFAKHTHSLWHGRVLCVLIILVVSIHKYLRQHCKHTKHTHTGTLATTLTFPFAFAFFFSAPNSVSLLYVRSTDHTLQQRFSRMRKQILCIHQAGVAARVLIKKNAYIMLARVRHARAPRIELLACPRARTRTLPSLFTRKSIRRMHVSRIGCPCRWLCGCVAHLRMTFLPAFCVFDGRCSSVCCRSVCLFCSCARAHSRLYYLSVRQFVSFPHS